MAARVLGPPCGPRATRLAAAMRRAWTCHGKYVAIISIYQEHQTCLKMILEGVFP
jgi:hypothetical protein